MSCIICTFLHNLRLQSISGGGLNGGVSEMDSEMSQYQWLCPLPTENIQVVLQTGTEMLPAPRTASRTHRYPGSDAYRMSFFYLHLALGWFEGVPEYVPLANVKHFRVMPNLPINVTFHLACHLEVRKNVIGNCRSSCDLCMLLLTNIRLKAIILTGSRMDWEGLHRGQAEMERHYSQIIGCFCLSCNV